MEQNETSEQPVLSTPAGPPVGPPGYAPPAHAPELGEPRFGAPMETSSGVRPQKTRWRDVIFGWRSALAVFVAGIVLGGLGGSALTVLIDHDRGNSPTINRFPGGQFGGGFNPYGGQFGGPSTGQGSSPGGTAGSAQGGTANGGSTGGEAG